MEPVEFIPLELWNNILNYAQIQVVYQISLTCKKLAILAQERLAIYLAALNELQSNHSIECFDQEISLQSYDKISRCQIFNFFKLDFGGNIQQMKEEVPFLFAAKQRAETLQKLQSLFMNRGSEQFVVVLEVEKKLIVSKVSSSAFNVYFEFKPPVLDIQVFFPVNSSLSINKQSTIALAASHVLRKISCASQDISCVCTLW